MAPKNLESCANAVRINDTDRQVRFEWTEALNVDQYELIVENSITKEKVEALPQQGGLYDDAKERATRV